ncbi:MarR family winged helix-turn-helix transcriptional regulator [Actinacidiphila glaucinigra]|uniref:MarR family winged helix-turn-helix transcriptional regulator n=1 Tax=Actinacidiphila glaucinigra TaxID=235986 RepID=UPI003D8FB440
MSPGVPVLLCPPALRAGPEPADGRHTPIPTGHHLGLRDNPDQDSQDTRIALEAPLDSDEERFWRALTRVVAALPKALDDDLSKATGLTLSEYTVLMRLSEADGGKLRIGDLASSAALSLSRISRMVNSLQARGWMGKRRHDHDARGWVTSLTDEGLRRRESAYPALLLSARRRVVDHVDCGAAAMTVHQIRRIASVLE